MSVINLSRRRQSAPRLAVLLGSLAVAGGSSPVWAQDGVPPPATAAADDVQGEIVVTARKRSETAQDVPISITLLSSEAVTQRGIRELQDIMTFAPDLQQSNGAIGGFRTIRGAGLVGSNFSFEQSVGLFFDEVSFGRNPQGRIPIFDVERVEVLRGPQVLSFGNSTTAGAVSLITKKPGDKFLADLTSTYEFNHDQFVLRGGITLPIADDVSVRVSGVTDQLAKGWIQAIGPNGQATYDPRNNINAGRVIINARPSQAIDLTIKYQHDDVRYNGSTMLSTTNRNNFPFIPSTRFRPVTFRAPADPLNQAPSTRLKQDLVQGTAEVDLGAVTITSNTAYWDYRFRQFEDSDTAQRPIAIANPNDDFRQFSQEVRLGGKLGDNIDVLTGLYYQHDKQYGAFVFSGNRAALGVANPQPPFARVSGVDQRARTWSGFVDLTLRVGRALEINPGVRYTDLSRRGRQFAYGSAALSSVPTNAFDAFLLPAFGATTHDYQLSAPESHWMPQLILSYKPSSRINLFAKFVKGAKAGGFDFNYVGNDPKQAVFRPEKVTDYEAGVKGSTADRRLTYSLTAFRSKSTDLQLSIFSVNRFALSNAGGQLSKGLEAEIGWRTPVPGLTINAAGTYLDAHYTDFRGATCTLEQSFTRPAPCTQDLSGTRSGFSSKWYGSLQTSYDRDIGNYRLGLSIDANYRSSYLPSTNNDPISRQSGQVILDARAQFGPAGDPWHVAVFGRNLTDHIYSNFYSPNGAGLTPGVSVA